MGRRFPETLVKKPLDYRFFFAIRSIAYLRKQIKEKEKGQETGGRKIKEKGENMVTKISYWKRKMRCHHYNQPPETLNALNIRPSWS